MRRPTRALVLILLLVLPGCATWKQPDGSPHPDPFEKSNRVMFAINEGFDKAIFEPIGKGWRFITPRFVRMSIDMAFVNMRYPSRAVSLLGQLRAKDAGEETLRFAVNTTVGIAGLWDPASRVGLDLYDEDFGQMFAYWGIGSGPYWVLPFFGPSSPRDTVGLAGDSVFNIAPWVMPYYTSTFNWVNSRAIAVPAISTARDTSLDYYVFVRDAYMKRRERQTRNLAPVMEDLPGPEDDFYEVEDDLYDLTDEPAEPVDGVPGGPGAAPPEGADATGEN